MQASRKTVVFENGLAQVGLIFDSLDGIIVSWQHNGPWRVVVAVCETEFFCNIFFGFKIEISLYRNDLQGGS